MNETLRSIFVVFVVLVITTSAFGGLALIITAGAEEITGAVIIKRDNV